MAMGHLQKFQWRSWPYQQVMQCKFLMISIIQTFRNVLSLTYLDAGLLAYHDQLPWLTSPRRNLHHSYIACYIFSNHLVPNISVTTEKKEPVITNIVLFCQSFEKSSCKPWSAGGDNIKASQVFGRDERKYKHC
jgi:hypothetical protein